MLCLHSLDVHHEIVHRPAGLDATLTNKAGELRIVTDAVQECVEEYGFAVGAGRAHTAGDEFQRFVPIDIGGQ